MEISDLFLFIFTEIWTVGYISKYPRLFSILVRLKWYCWGP
jgi:hypothetical protein